MITQHVFFCLKSLSNLLQGFAPLVLWSLQLILLHYFSIISIKNGFHLLDPLELFWPCSFSYYFYFSCFLQRFDSPKFAFLKPKRYSHFALLFINESEIFPPLFVKLENQYVIALFSTALTFASFIQVSMTFSKEQFLALLLLLDRSFINLAVCLFLWLSPPGIHPSSYPFRSLAEFSLQIHWIKLIDPFESI